MTENKEEIIIPKWELIKDIYKNYYNIRKNFWWLFLFLILNTLFIISEPYFYKQFLDNIQSFSTGKITYEIIKGNFIILAIIRCIITILGIISQWGYDYFINKIMHIDRNRLAVKVGNSFILLPYNDFVNTNPGSQQSTFTKGTDAFWSFGHNILSRILPQLLLFISLFSFGLYINWKMALLSLIFIPFSILATYRIGGLIYNKQKEANNSWRKSNQRLNDTLNNIGIIKIFAKEKQEISILEKSFTNSMILQVSSNFLWNILKALLKGIQVFGSISVMIIGVFFVVNGYLTIGELLVFIYISGRITGPIEVLLSSYQELIKELANYYKVKQIIDSPKEVNEGTIEFKGLKNSVVFNNVSFNYEKSNREILKNLNLEIIKGQKIALVGHTGSGKTTISNLITRFYDTISGEVLIDGINIKDYTLESYRNKLAAVFQDTTLFNDTIINNLKYINEDATIGKIRDACKKAEILDFIDKLEKGFETEVGEKGLKLSGGERQRMSIARAILRNPDILILDEPTSALDSKTESIIQKSLNNLMKGRTSIVIAHRLSTIKNADKIYLLEDGEIIDSGTHEELCKKSRIYKEMVDYQKNGFIEENS